MASYPNRSQEVKKIVARYPQAFGPPDETLDARRRLLIPIIVRELNKLDGGKWFLLNRMDRQDDDPRPGRLTADIIVWGPTKEHVDVLSSKGAMWGEQPVITDPDWKLEHPDNWPSWDDVGPIPNPPPPPTPVDPNTHMYMGGGNDTGKCDQCGQPRNAAVHAIPQSKVKHAYDGGEQDTGLCDICGQGREYALHQADQPGPVDPGPVTPGPVTPPPSGDLEARVQALEALVSRVKAAFS